MQPRERAISSSNASSRARRSVGNCNIRSGFERLIGCLGLEEHMGERISAWVTAFSTSAVVAVGVFSVGCGPYEEADYPQQYQYVAPPPPTAAELAAQQQAREQAAAESREILIGADSDEYSDTDPSALTEFKPALEGHGTWVDDATYGTVWVPSSAEVGTDFQPYVTAGHWTYSESTDYVWVSDYSWGWAPFHYGRWVYLPGHGWAWIPGRRYAGAWVTWRVGPSGYGYVGWAPMAPSWYWYRGTAIGWSFGYYDPYGYYVYCPRTHVYHGTVSTYVVRGPAAREHDTRTQDYVPASPVVAAGGRVVANPSVNGGTRVVATPSVGGGRVVASPAVTKGPRPDELGLKNELVVAPPGSHEGLARAQAYAVPKTAIGAGAAPPAHVRPDIGAPPSGPVVGHEPRAALAAPSSVRSLGVSPSPTFRPSPPPAISTPQPSVRSSDRIFGSSGSSPYRSSPSVAAVTPTFRSPPSVSAPSPTFRSLGPPSVFRSSPSISSTPSPSFRSSPPASFRATPSISSTPSPSFRSSPPASFHSSPVVRSSPSVSSGPTFRSPSPAVRSFRKR